MKPAKISSPLTGGKCPEGTKGGSDAPASPIPPPGLRPYSPLMEGGEKQSLIETQP